MGRRTDMRDNIIIAAMGLIIIICVGALVKPEVSYGTVQGKYTSPNGEYVVVNGNSYKGEFSIGDKVKLYDAMLWNKVSYN